jgi:hypothetical protein
MGKKRRRDVLIVRSNVQPSPQASPEAPPKKIPGWQLPLNWAKNHPITWVAGVIVSIGWGIWLYTPPWTLTLPSASYRPRNPFTAIFTITNNDLFPGYDVRIKCTQNMIKYVMPRVFSKASSDVTPLGDMYRTDSRTFSCPQTFLSVQTWNRALHPKKSNKCTYRGRRRKTCPSNGRTSSLRSPTLGWSFTTRTGTE